MRYLPSDKYNVAWFKLAECVSRGEKERALGVYRLLSHSFDDAAFAAQLEGDILLSFDDEVGAVVKYRQALLLYQQSHRLLEAASVGEHLLMLAPTKSEYICLLIEIYKALEMRDKLVNYLHMLCALALGSDQIETASYALYELEQLTELHEVVTERSELIKALLVYSPEQVAAINTHIQKLIEGLVACQDTQKLQQFLTYLEVSHEQFYAFAHSCLQKNRCE